jgi:hypothetical protein
MAAKRKPGPDGSHTASHPGGISQWSGVALGWVRNQVDRTAEEAESLERHALGTGKSTLLSILDLLPLKPDSPFSTRLLKHYVEGSGEPYELGEIPEPWQDWIVTATKARPGRHADLSPYNSGIYDLRNSLGHFDVVVTQQRNSQVRIYEIKDVYEFGFIRSDKNQQVRHGFPLGQLGENTIHVLEFMLPSEEFKNPGGFEEKWEIRKVRKETILYIPQQVLAHQGTPFKVHGSFQR